jgi:hypothetical protein
MWMPFHSRFFPSDHEVDWGELVEAQKTRWKRWEALTQIEKEVFEVHSSAYREGVYQHLCKVIERMP